MSMPSSKRARLSSMLTPNTSNSLGMNARPNPTSSRPLLRLSSTASSAASLTGLLKAGITAPVISRIRCVRAATAARNTTGFGERPP